MIEEVVGGSVRVSVRGEVMVVCVCECVCVCVCVREGDREKT